MENIQDASSYVDLLRIFHTLGKKSEKNSSNYVYDALESIPTDVILNRYDSVSLPIFSIGSKSTCCFIRKESSIPEELNDFFSDIHHMPCEPPDVLLTRSTAANVAGVLGSSLESNQSSNLIAESKNQFYSKISKWHLMLFHREVKWLLLILSHPNAEFRLFPKLISLVNTLNLLNLRSVMIQSILVLCRIWFNFPDFEIAHSSYFLNKQKGDEKNKLKPSVEYLAELFQSIFSDHCERNESNQSSDRNENLTSEIRTIKTIFHFSRYLPLLRAMSELLFHFVTDHTSSAIYHNIDDIFYPLLDSVLILFKVIEFLSSNHIIDSSVYMSFLDCPEDAFLHDISTIRAQLHICCIILSVTLSFILLHTSDVVDTMCAVNFLLKYWLTDRIVCNHIGHIILCGAIPSFQKILSDKSDYSSKKNELYLSIFWDVNNHFKDIFNNDPSYQINLVHMALSLLCQSTSWSYYIFPNEVGICGESEGLTYHSVNCMIGRIIQATLFSPYSLENAETSDNTIRHTSFWWSKCSLEGLTSMLMFLSSNSQSNPSIAISSLPPILRILQNKNICRLYKLEAKEEHLLQCLIWLHGVAIVLVAFSALREVDQSPSNSNGHRFYDAEKDENLMYEIMNVYSLNLNERETILGLLSLMCQDSVLYDYLSENNYIKQTNHHSMSWISISIRIALGTLSIRKQGRHSNNNSFLSELVQGLLMFLEHILESITREVFSLQELEDAIGVEDFAFQYSSFLSELVCFPSLEVISSASAKFSIFTSDYYLIPYQFTPLWNNNLLVRSAIRILMKYLARNNIVNLLEAKNLYQFVFQRFLSSFTAVRVDAFLHIVDSRIFLENRTCGYFPGKGEYKVFHESVLSRLEFFSCLIESLTSLRSIGENEGNIAAGFLNALIATNLGILSEKHYGFDLISALHLRFLSSWIRASHQLLTRFPFMNTILSTKFTVAKEAVSLDDYSNNKKFHVTSVSSRWVEVLSTHSICWILMAYRWHHIELMNAAYVRKYLCLLLKMIVSAVVAGHHSFFASATCSILHISRQSQSGMSSNGINSNLNSNLKATSPPSFSGGKSHSYLFHERMYSKVHLCFLMLQLLYTFDSLDLTEHLTSVLMGILNSPSAALCIPSMRWNIPAKTWKRFSLTIDHFFGSCKTVSEKMANMRFNVELPSYRDYCLYGLLVFRYLMDNSPNSLESKREDIPADLPIEFRVDGIIGGLIEAKTLGKYLKEIIQPDKNLELYDLCMIAECSRIERHLLAICGNDAGGLSSFFKAKIRNEEDLNSCISSSDHIKGGVCYSWDLANAFAEELLTIAFQWSFLEQIDHVELLRLLKYTIVLFSMLQISWTHVLENFGVYWKNNLNYDYNDPKDSEESKFYSSMLLNKMKHTKPNTTKRFHQSTMNPGFIACLQKRPREAISSSASGDENSVKQIAKQSGIENLSNTSSSALHNSALKTWIPSVFSTKFQSTPSAGHDIGWCHLGGLDSHVGPFFCLAGASKDRSFQIISSILDVSGKLSASVETIILSYQGKHNFTTEVIDQSVGVFKSLWWHLFNFSILIQAPVLSLQEKFNRSFCQISSLNSILAFLISQANIVHSYQPCRNKMSARLTDQEHVGFLSNDSFKLEIYPGDVNELISRYVEKSFSLMEYASFKDCIIMLNFLASSIKVVISASIKDYPEGRGSYARDDDENQRNISHALASHKGTTELFTWVTPLIDFMSFILSKFSDTQTIDLLELIEKCEIMIVYLGSLISMKEILRSSISFEVFINAIWNIANMVIQHPNTWELLPGPTVSLGRTAIHLLVLMMSFWGAPIIQFLPRDIIFSSIEKLETQMYNESPGKGECKVSSHGLLITQSCSDMLTFFTKYEQSSIHFRNGDKYIESTICNSELLDNIKSVQSESFHGTEGGISDKIPLTENTYLLFENSWHHLWIELLYLFQTILLVYPNEAKQFEWIASLRRWTTTSSRFKQALQMSFLQYEPLGPVLWCSGSLHTSITDISKWFYHSIGQFNEGSNCHIHRKNRFPSLKTISSVLNKLQHTPSIMNMYESFFCGSIWCSLTKLHLRSEELLQACKEGFLQLKKDPTVFSLPIVPKLLERFSFDFSSGDSFRMKTMQFYLLIFMMQKLPDSSFSSLEQAISAAHTCAVNLPPYFLNGTGLSYDARSNSCTLNIDGLCQFIVQKIALWKKLWIKCAHGGKEVDTSEIPQLCENVKNMASNMNMTNSIWDNAYACNKSSCISHLKETYFYPWFSCYGDIGSDLSSFDTGASNGKQLFEKSLGGDFFQTWQPIAYNTYPQDSNIFSERTFLNDNTLTGTCFYPLTSVECNNHNSTYSLIYSNLLSDNLRVVADEKLGSKLMNLDILTLSRESPLLADLFVLIQFSIFLLLRYTSWYASMPYLPFSIKKFLAEVVNNLYRTISHLLQKYQHLFSHTIKDFFEVPKKELEFLIKIITG